MKETKFIIIIIKLKVNKVESKHCDLNNCKIIYFKRISLAPLRKKHLTAMKEILNNTSVNIIHRSGLLKLV